MKSSMPMPKVFEIFDFILCYYEIFYPFGIIIAEGKGIIIEGDKIFDFYAEGKPCYDDALA